MSKIGICSKCNQGPRQIDYRDKETGRNICAYCYQEVKYGKGRTGRRVSKYPGSEVLDELIAKHEANLFLISKSLFEEQGIEVATSTIFRWFYENKTSRELVSKIRKAKKAAKARMVITKHVLCPEAESVKPRTETTIREKTTTIFEMDKEKLMSLPLADEEWEILRTPGESAEEIASKLQKAGGRIGILRENILLKKNAATLEEVRKKLGIVLEFQEELTKE